jgi:hypothetical protein
MYITQKPLLPTLHYNFNRWAERKKSNEPAVQRGGSQASEENKVSLLPAPLIYILQVYNW